MPRADGATYLSATPDNNDWTKARRLTKTIHHGGAQSLEILKSRPIPSVKSWCRRGDVLFRVYLQTDVAMAVGRR